MKTPIRVLIVEDDEVDAELLRLKLSEIGGAFSCRRVWTEDGLRTELDRCKPDLILSDYTMPGFDGAAALRIAVGKCPEVPFLFVSGSIGEERAIEALKSGATDYILKDRMARLIPCVQRALREAHERDELSRMAKVREIFGHFATPEVVRLMLAHPDDFWKRGGKKVLTVLFADVRGFTEYANRTDPREVVRSLNEIFDRIIEAIRSEDGILNKFLGDGVMAMFGAPVPMAGHADAAARAALKALESVGILGRDRNLRGLEALQVGIGINSGEMLAGCVGTEERMEYSVIGHAVNLASRLESVAGPGQILLGPGTTERLSSDFRCRSLGPMRLHGIAAPVAVWELRRTQPQSPGRREEAYDHGTRQAAVRG